MQSGIEKMFQKYIMCPQAAYSLAREIKLMINISFTSLKVPKTHKEDTAKTHGGSGKGVIIFIRTFM